jgi:hypothetical protein
MFLPTTRQFLAIRDSSLLPLFTSGGNLRAFNRPLRRYVAICQMLPIKHSIAKAHEECGRICVQAG